MEPDYDSMSIEELQAIVAKEQQQQPAEPDYDSMSIEELEAIVEAEGGMPKGPVEAFARGAGESLSLGFSDEIVGGAKTLFNEKSLEENIDDERAANIKARQDSPRAGLLGSLGGSILGPGKFLQGAKGLKAIATSTGLGAATGAGQSTGKIGSEEFFTDTARGAALSGTLSAAGQLAGTASKIKPSVVGERAAGVLKTATKELPAPLAKFVQKHAHKTMGTKANAAYAIAKQIEKQSEKLKGTKFAGFLSKAADKTPASLIATHKALMKDEPEYKKIIESKKDK